MAANLCCRLYWEDFISLIQWYQIKTVKAIDK